jgi:hypothetical protein
MANKSVGFLTIAFGADMRGFDKAMKKAQRNINKFGTSLQRTGETLTRNITLPVIGLGAAAIKMASDFEETDAKFRTVFSSIEQQALATAKTFEKSFGLSSKAAKQMLGDTGDLLVGFGFTEQEALNLSKQVNELAVDLASFTNFSGGAEGASLALTKALLGERESVKSLGIAITEADLKKFAEDQGLVFKELDRVAKANLTFQLAAKQSSKAIGDYARTSGSFANQTRQLTAQFTNLAVEIGTMLLPVAQKILTWVRDFLDNIRKMNPVLKQNILNFTLLAAAIGPLLSISGSLLKTFSKLFSRSGLIVMGLAAIVAGFLYVRENYEAFKERLSDWTWWRNALVEAAADFVEIMGGGRFGKFLGLGDPIRKFKVEANEYKHEFTTFADAIKNQATDLAESIGLLSNPFQLGDGGGGDPKPKTHIDFLKNMPFKNAMDNFGKKIEDTTQKQIALNEATKTFENVFSSAMTSAAYSQEGFFKSFLENLKQAIKQMLIQLAITTAIKFMFGGGKLTLKDAFGKGLKDVFNLSKVPELASGGIVTGPTMALIGEGNESEAVLPLSKLNTMINNNGGGVQKVEVYGRISGNDIFLANQRGSINRFRSV